MRAAACLDLPVRSNELALGLSSSISNYSQNRIATGNEIHFQYSMMSCKYVLIVVNNLQNLSILSLSNCRAQILATISSSSIGGPLICLDMKAE